jgi:uncharacterized protein YodC (DUF2158 family)
LKSGPEMTVEDIGEYSVGIGGKGEMSVKCTWFEAKKRVEDVFVPATLVKKA